MSLQAGIVCMNKAPVTLMPLYSYYSARIAHVNHMCILVNLYLIDTPIYSSLHKISHSIK